MDKLINDCLHMDKLINDCLLMDELINDCLHMDKLINDCLHMDKLINDCLLMDELINNCLHMAKIISDWLYIDSLIYVRFPQLLCIRKGQWWAKYRLVGLFHIQTYEAILMPSSFFYLVWTDSLQPTMDTLILTMLRRMWISTWMWKRPGNQPPTNPWSDPLRTSKARTSSSRWAARKLDCLLLILFSISILIVYYQIQWKPNSNRFKESSNFKNI